MKHTIFQKNLFNLLILLWIMQPSNVLGAEKTLLEQLKAMSTVEKVEQLQTTEFAEKYVVYFRQPIDHKHPELGHFSQRVIVGHSDFDRPTVMVTEGYGAAYALRPGYREEISRLFNANMIFVEHRYFLKSTPKTCDWKYLTAENSADDLHAVNMAFKALYSKKWVSTGISKGGQTALLYRTFYPDDVAVSVPYVAPLCRAREDGRHEPFIQSVSTVEERNRVKNFQLEVLKRRATLMPVFEEFCNQNRYIFRASCDEIFDYCVLEYSFSVWQWGIDISQIPSTASSDSILFKHLISISDPSYFQIDNPNLSFFVQAARELGYYGYDTKSFKPFLSIRTTKNYLQRLMLPEKLQTMDFDSTLSRKITKFLKSNDPKMIFIYGQNDPWTAAGVTWLKGKRNIHVYVQPGGSHLARIKTLPNGMKEEVVELLTKWLE
ncbi:MAG: S28 family serine protease [Bacteroides sp.]